MSAGRPQRRRAPALRRLLHPSDFSPASRAALETALALARRERARLDVLHVMVPPSPFVVTEARGTRTYLDLDAAARREAQDGLKGVEARARRAGVRVHSRLVEGVPFEEITRAARRLGVDAIVMGTHGRSGFRRLLMGSVTARVLARAPCPVITVRGR